MQRFRMQKAAREAVTKCVGKVGFDRRCDLRQSSRAQQDGFASVRYPKDRVDNEQSKPEDGLDPRHIGRFYDKEMPIDMPGMELGKPGLPDMRRRKHSVTIPESASNREPDNPPQTQR